MPANNSMVEVSWFQHPQQGPSLLVVASDPDGIKTIEVFSRHRRVPRLLNGFCGTNTQDVIFHYPKSWFPVTVRITDCDANNVNIDIHGPFDEDGDSLAQQNQIPPLPPPQDESEQEEPPNLPNIEAAVRHVLKNIKLKLG